MNKIKCNYKTPNFIYLENILEVIDEFITKYDKLKELSTDMFEFQDVSEYTKAIIFKSEKIMRDIVRYTRREI